MSKKKTKTEFQKYESIFAKLKPIRRKVAKKKGRDDE